MRKPELEFFPAETVGTTPCDPPVEGLSERVLASCTETGVATRMLHFASGTDTSPVGPVTHDFWEEVYIVSGDLHDLSLDQVFTAGMYACRPPGMVHGPWRSAGGCTTFEVRYPAGGRDAR